jgi:hypothetical protein
VSEDSLINPKLKLHKYVGLLEFYFETGMEQMGVIFHDDRGNHEGPKWDNPNETMIYRSLSWAIWLGDRAGLYKIRIFDKENNVVYEGPLTQDKRKIKESKYSISFLPKEIDKRTWIKYCQEEYRAELYTNMLTDALQQEYKLDFKIGEQVHDDLTSKDVVVLNVTLGNNKTVGYWVNSDYLEGGRHPWELSKIDWRKRWEEEKKKHED